MEWEREKQARERLMAEVCTIAVGSIVDSLPW